MKPWEWDEDEGATVTFTVIGDEAEVTALVEEMGLHPSSVGMTPVELSVLATAILKRDRKERHGHAHGAADGWLSPYQLRDRRSREVSGHIRLEPDMPEWIETFDFIPHFARPETRSAIRHEFGSLPQRTKQRADLGFKKGQRRSFCIRDGCDNPRHTLDLCQMHYVRQRRNDGDLGPPEPLYQERGEECSIEDCTKPVASRGLCSMHYARQRRNGSPTTRLRQEAKGLTCSECDRPAFSRGWCQNHYMRWYRQRGKGVSADAA